MATILKADLTAALKRAAPALSRGGNVLPVLTCAHIHAQDGRLTVQTSDLDLTITTSVPCDGDLPATVASGKLLAAYVDGLSGTIDLSVEDTSLLVRSGLDEMRLRTHPADSWPRAVAAEGTPVALDERTLSAFARVTFAASRDESRPMLTGICCRDGWVAATDSYRLAAHRVPDGLAPAIIPARAAQAVLKQVKACRLTTDEARATFATDDTTWTTRLIAGEYPKWENLKPTPSHNVLVDRTVLLEGLARVAVLSDGTRPVCVSGEGDVLRLRVLSDDGQVDCTVPADCDFEGQLGVNPAYLKDLLEALTTERVTLGITDTSKPVLATDGDFMSLLMPVRIAS